MKNTIFAIAAFIVFTGFSDAQIKNTENTFRLADDGISERSAISDVTFLAGSWLGTGLGGVSEETWSKPQGGIMVGTYRLMKDDKPIFYEMMWLMEIEGSLILRLKHFGANLVGWEDKDKTVDFKFVRREGKRVYFSGLTFENAGSGELNIYLALRQRDGTLKEEAFKMKRVNNQFN